MSSYPTDSARGRRGRKLRKLSGLTEGLIAPAMRKRGQILTKIIAGWPDIAGDAHQWCLPADINFPQNSRIQATLTVSVASGRGPQIQQMTPDICKRINSYCGYAAVSRIKIRQDFIPICVSLCRSLCGAFLRLHLDKGSGWHSSARWCFIHCSI